LLGATKKTLPRVDKLLAHLLQLKEVDATVNAVVLQETKVFMLDVLVLV